MQLEMEMTATIPAAAAAVADADGNAPEEPTKARHRKAYCRVSLP